MMPSLFSAVSGLSNHQTLMDVIGDNIANVNTIGFKSSRVSFATGFSQLLQGADAPTDTTGGKNGIEVGLGMRIGSIDRIFKQGNFENTGNRTDLAIQGDGFFVVGDGTSKYYTRAGGFQVDANGALLAEGGRYHVLGRLADKNGVITNSSNVEALRLPYGEKDPAKSTSSIKYFCNLDANASTKRTFNTSIAFTQDSLPATAATDLNNLDQVSAALDDGDVIHVTGTNRTGQPVDVSFTYGAGNDGVTLGDVISRINSAAGFDSTSQTGSTLTVDASGKLILRDNLSGSSQTAISMTFEDHGANPSVMMLPTFVNTEAGTTGTHATSIDVYDSRGEKHRVEMTFTQDVAQANVWNWNVVVDGGAIDAANNGLNGSSGRVRFNTDGSLLAFEGGPLTFTPPEAQGMVINLNGGTVGTFEGITQFASPSTTIALNQDGHGMGVLQDFTVDTTGTITGSYSNGITRTLGQIALARFANPSGLQLAGQNVYAATVNSGDAMVGLSGNVNQVYSGYLEMSNVDLAKEFTEMIIAQRGFQASARVISVADSLLNEVTQLKR